MTFIVENACPAIAFKDPVPFSPNTFCLPGSKIIANGTSSLRPLTEIHGHRNAVYWVASPRLALSEWDIFSHGDLGLGFLGGFDEGQIFEGNDGNLGLAVVSHDYPVTGDFNASNDVPHLSAEFHK